MKGGNGINAKDAKDRAKVAEKDSSFAFLRENPLLPLRLDASRCDEQTGTNQTN
jgi:hypothetical protein